MSHTLFLTVGGTMESAAVLLILALLLGAIFGWVSFFKLRAIQKQVSGLQRTLRNIVHRLENLGLSLSEISELSSRIDTPTIQQPQKQTETDQDIEPLTGENPAVSSSNENVWTGEPEYDSTDNGAIESPSRFSSEPVTEPSISLFSLVREQWMIWLGGISIGLSGIFMVRYSIEQGLLGPLARVLLSVLGGIVLHAVAEWGRRRNREHFQAFAALAGGASIILYSAFLAALNLYDLFPAGLVFVALIIVSLATMALAVLHGPVLAILGILGAYVIPALVDTGSDDVLSLYLYSLIITAAALLLMHHVYRPWLWSGMLAGSLGWWFLTIDSYGALGLRAYYLAALLYLYLAMPSWDWLLQKSTAHKSDSNSTSEGQKQTQEASLAKNAKKSVRFPNSISEAPGLLSIGLLILAFGLTIATEQRVASAIYQWTPFVAILLVAAGNKPELLRLVAASLIIQFLAWLSLGLTTYDGVRLEGLIGPSQFDFAIYAAWMAFVYSALSLRNLLTSSNRNFCCALHWLWAPPSFG